MVAGKSSTLKKIYPGQWTPSSDMEHISIDCTVEAK